MQPLRPAKALLATAFLSAALVSIPGASNAQSIATSEVVNRIVNGTVTGDFPSTGALLSPSNPATASILCSGTLIGCQTFLTAGHCVADDLNPTHYTVFLQHAGFFSVKSIALRPDFNFPVGDVAVLSLAMPIDGIRPTPINTTSAPAAGLPGTIVGFGRTGGGGANQDYGVKRVGSVTTATCKNGVSNTTSVCWDFHAPQGAPGTNSNTCNGDSGGPLFINFGAGWRVAGVTSGGDSDTCLPTDASFDANVFAYASWIQGQAGSDLTNTKCGSLPQVGDAGTSVFAFTGEINSGNSTATHTFQVAPGTAELRVSMNGIDNGSDFDLFVKAGSAPSLSSFDCRQNGPGQFAFCEFPTPLPGSWYVLVNGSAGGGTYQVTATTFGGGCADSANTGQSCDDNNPCTSNDRCQSGSCIGSSVADGTSCDDNDPCTQSDSCQASVCKGSAAPRADCHEPFVTPSGLFQLQDITPGQPDAADTLTWNWLRGSATQKGEFGDPITTTSYDLCVFDESGGSPELVMSEHVAAGSTCASKPCWNETSTSFKYTDKRLENGPISSLSLKAGNNGRARITMKGKGTKLAIPTLPLHEQNTVTVQLSNQATCWLAHYSDSTRNDAFQFKSRAH